MIRIALLALLSTACSMTIRLGNTGPDYDYAPSLPAARPTATAPAAAPAPKPAAPKPVVKRVAKKKPAPKPTAEVCAAKRAEADACDAAVKVETCKAACEPPPAAPTTPAP